MAVAPTHIFEAKTEEISSVVVAHVVKVSESSIRERGKFVIALSGGSLPKYLDPLLQIIPESSWEYWHVFFADERVVPIDHPDSNFVACKEILAKIPTNQIYPLPLVDIENDLKNPSLLSTRYEELIRQSCDINSQNQMPIFDLIMLGMGPDGHTASLFPQHFLSYVTSSRNEVEQAAAEDGSAFRNKAVAYLIDSPKPPPERITLTLDAINSSRNVIFVATGASKADVVSKCFVLNDEMVIPDPSSDYPCSFIKPTITSDESEISPLTWYLDVEAASQLRVSFSTTMPMNYTVITGKNCSEEELPYFVYGTLIKGFRNHRVVEPYLEKACEGTIQGAKVLHFSHAGFPGIYPADMCCKVKGELCFIKSGCEKQASEALDSLEGFYGENNPRNLYDKKIVDVTSESFAGSRKAYAYWCTINQEEAKQEWGGVPIEEEDPIQNPGVVSWKHHMLSNGLVSAGADWHEKANGGR